MVKQPIKIGELNFPKKGDAADHYRALLHKYGIGERIVEPDSTELYWLFERHPEFAAKSGSGVDGFAVRSAVYGTRCFEVLRKDGTKTDFSAKTCIDGKEPPLQAQAIAAMRAEVSDQIIQMKWKSFREGTDEDGIYRCPITSTPISMDDASVHFVPPNTFRALALKFVSLRGIELDETFICPSRDNQYEPEMRDRNLAGEWREWHESHAKIVAIAKTRISGV